MFSVVRLVRRSLTAVLLSAAVAVGPFALTPPAAMAAPSAKQASLSLSPTQGPPGTEVTVDGSDFYPCGQATLTFDGGSPTPAVVDSSAYTVTGTVVVPQGTAPGSYQIVATCDTDPDTQVATSASATFTVTGGGGGTTTPTDTPQLTLDPDRGPPGQEYSVSGSGFGKCTDGVELYVVDGPVLEPKITVDAETGGFSYVAYVYADSPPNEYTIRAACIGYPETYADAVFTVVSPANPVLALDPTEGAKGTPVQANGTGFTCPDVDILWDGDQLLANPSVSETGTFAADFAVPDDATPGEHPVRAQCAADEQQYAEVSFTVTDGGGGTDTGGTETGGTDTGGTDTGGTDTGGTDTGGTDTGGTDGGGTGGGGEGTTPVGWVVGPASLGGALLLAAAALVYFGRLHRGPRWVRNHVRATLRPATGTADLIEQPPPGGPPTHTTRLEPYADPGEQTIEEEDR
ncbi:IPT/TIG domain-containing protein [Streptomyces vilmorinianum]|uniref:IPT/TIG domain-containing protein n=1 Tax=Streptomyces vilmorinianum TaxID=3051092 RepID=UPI0010FAF540|nr:IPT/TIG domain-containing protein [Streptomyces vilmorinianum]